MQVALQYQIYDRARLYRERECRHTSPCLLHNDDHEWLFRTAFEYPKIGGFEPACDWNIGVARFLCPWRPSQNTIIILIAPDTDERVSIDLQLHHPYSRWWCWWWRHRSAVHELSSARRSLKSESSKIVQLWRACWRAKVQFRRHMWDIRVDKQAGWRAMASFPSTGIA